MGFRFLIATLLSLPAYSSITGNTFVDAKTEFSISKPVDWQFVRDVKSYGLQLKNDQLMKANNDFLVAFTAKRKSARGITPSVAVTKLNTAGKSPQAWLDDEIERHAAHDKYFVRVSSALVTKIDYDEGAVRAAFINNTVINGYEAHAYHVLYIVRSRGQAFLIHMDCNENEAHGVVDIFSEIAGSIEVKSPETI